MQEFLTECFKHVNLEDVKTIFDIGAGDCKETLLLAENFQCADVYAFECNPVCILDCSKRILNTPRTHLITTCIYNRNGTIKFHPINKDLTITQHPDGNPRASSVYVANGTYPLETYAQDELSMLCTRLDTLICIHDLPKPDLIWMDLQGSELAALQGLGIFLEYVKFIHTEVTLKPIYTGQDLFPEVNEYLERNGFKLLTKYDPNGIWMDVNYARD
jgi:FkbM family methyltransferase